MKGEKNKKILVVIISLFYEIVIDKENFDSIKNMIENTKDIQLYELALKNRKVKTLYPEIIHFTSDNYDENPNIYIEKVAKMKSHGNSSDYDSNLKRELILQKDFDAKYEKLSEYFKNIDQLKEKLRNLMGFT